MPSNATGVLVRTALRTECEIVLPSRNFMQLSTMCALGCEALDGGEALSIVGGVIFAITLRCDVAGRRPVELPARSCQDVKRRVGRV